MKTGVPHVLFEDKQILILRKPPGWLSQPDGSGRPDVLGWAREHIRTRWNKPGAAYAGLCHRLDLPVGGVMAIARTSKAARRISEQFRERTTEKLYLALCRGVPNRESGKIEGRLVRAGNITVEAPGEDGVKAALAWRLDWQGKIGGRESSLLEVDLLTGVKHQIRGQLSGAGLPIWGDTLYGSPDATDGPGRPEDSSAIGLFAARLSLDHPVTRERLSFGAMPDPQGWPWRLLKSAGYELG
jgi:23S rRNA-/tRNA-specific pseudouridylate synthase